MLRLAFDFIITWRETRTRPNAYFPMEALKFPNVPITVSSTIRTTGECSYVLVTLIVDSAI